MTAAVSVVIPCHNYGHYLEAAIESILSQTTKPEQIIVVDDGSSDDSAAVAHRFGDPVQLVSRVNGGISAARNTGVRAACGEMLAFLDADDLWTPDKLERQLAALRADPCLDCVFCHARQFVSPELPADVRAKIACPENSMPARLASAMLIRRNVFLDIGLFDESLAIAETVDWLARAVESGMRSAILPEVLLRRRLHQSNSGVVRRDARMSYGRALKSALDRRRQRQGGTSDAQ
ncbi:MAG: glycosyltransferase family 2 protein [Gemmatimonadetes bacterium]|nr:glycosyltransferase family 2 protein [Gemmatimonadota bacterium]